jgi:hypothetical protein
MPDEARKRDDPRDLLARCFHILSFLLQILLVEY